VKFIYSFLFISIALIASGQSELDEINISFDGSECFGYTPSFSQNRDSLNYYILLESYFTNDSIIIMSEDSVIFSDKVKTDMSLGFGKKIKLGSVSDLSYFKVGINENPLIRLTVTADLNYIRVGYSWDRSTIIFCYSKYQPIYY